MDKSVYTEVEGQQVRLTNLEKILFPTAQITKAELVEYYLSVSEHMLRHSAGRPLTLIRYPDGITGTSFYTKNKPSWTPDWIPSHEYKDTHETEYLVFNSRAHIAWISNLAAIELHSSNSTISEIDQPDHFIIDIDPPEQSEFADVISSASRLKKVLEQEGFRPYIMLSGGKGAHIRVPIIPNYGYSQLSDFLKRLMKRFIRHNKDHTLSIKKDKRKGKILLDIYRNHKWSTAIIPYGLRAKPGAPIALPIHWDELSQIKSSQEYLLRDGITLIKERANPWASFFTEAIELPIANKSSFAYVEKPRVSPSAVSTPNYEPMLCTEVKKLPETNPNELYEIKWDGIRVGIIKSGKKFSIYSRSGRDITAQFPECVVPDSVHASVAVVDAELVVLDEKGKPMFHEVISRLHTTSSVKIKSAAKHKAAVIYAFDLIHLDNRDLRSEKLVDRRKKMIEIIAPSRHIRISESFEDGSTLVDAAKSMNLEGIIIKKKNSPYESGIRSQHWRKYKFKSEIDCSIIGYTEGNGNRSHLFGALHLARVIDSKYNYLGKVGTGFTVDQMSDILDKLQACERVNKLIDEAVEEENRSIWLLPMYGCRIEYSSLSSNGTLREPVFKQIYTLKK